MTVVATSCADRIPLATMVAPEMRYQGAAVESIRETIRIQSQIK
jgi:hypothetical protein